MHRLIITSVLLFWAVLFSGLAHLSLSGLLESPARNASDFALLVAKSGDFQIMPVMLMVVAALFVWAVLALVVLNDVGAFREVESYAYGTAIFVLGACAALAFAKLGIMTSMPAVLVTALATCIAASQHMLVASSDEIDSDHIRIVARRMAISAAHNSLLSRVSGRPIPGHKTSLKNVSIFPVKPVNGGNL